MHRLLVDLVTNSSRFAKIASSFGPDTHPNSWMRALAVFDEHGELRISEFARLYRCSQPSATATIKRLLEKDLLARRPDPHDARAVRVTITEDGRNWLRTSKDELADAVAPLFRDLEPAQLRRLSDGLEELRTILKSAVAIGTPTDR
nr:MarR family winged helix-turn-helix transcriptional regulator [Rhodococcus sp. HNM0569]